MKILLMDEPILKEHDYSQNTYMPLIGLGYLAAALQQSQLDCEVKLLDCRIAGLTLRNVERQIRELQPNIVGIRAFTQNIIAAGKAAELAKKINSDTVTVVGGPHATALPEKTLEEFPAFDFAVFGEGEGTFVELCMKLDSKMFKKIEGLCYRESGTIVKNEARRFTQDLDELPMINWGDLVDLDQYWAPPGAHRVPGKVLPVMTTRGCPYKCIFCQRPHGRVPRVRSVKFAVNDIERNLLEYGARCVHFCDETFTWNKKRVMDICNEIIARGLHNKISWNCTSRADNVDYETFKKMREAGCYRISMGVESGNQRILDKVNKGITLEEAEDTVKNAKKAGLKVHCNFIIGHPFETKETINDTVDFAIKLDPNATNFAIMVPFPGTEVASMVERGYGGYKKRTADWSKYGKQLGDALELKNLDRKALHRAQCRAYIRFYLRPSKIRRLFLITNTKSLMRYAWKTIKAVVSRFGINSYFMLQ